MDQMRAILFLILSVLCCNAATYYVRTDGNDSNTGTADNAGGAWLTVQKSAATAAAGDHVYIRAGTYNEYVTNTASGSAGSPIVFEGEMDGTNWLTIINPSTAFTSGWVTASEVGSGVWKQTNMPFTVRELTIDNKRVAFVYSMGDISTAIGSAYSGSGLTTGAEILALSSAQTLTLNGSGTVSFWDSVTAMWGYETNAAYKRTTYLRLRDGSDPNGLNIRCARNAETFTTSISAPTVRIEDKSYITWTNVSLKGGFTGFYLWGTNTHHVAIEGNYISGGYERVHFRGGPHDNLVRTNFLTTDYYGTNDIGAWDPGSYNREHLYLVAKYLMGQNESFDQQIGLIGAGPTNVFYGNRLVNGLGTGFDIFNILASFQVTTGTVFMANVVDGHPSAGILLSVGHAYTLIASNYIADNDINIRYHQCDSNTETYRSAFILRNTLWQPTSVGLHTYIHFNNGTPSSYIMEVWAYHNSYSGGAGGITASSFAYDEDGLTNMFWLNNIFNDTVYWLTDDSQAATAAVGVFDYNIITPPFHTYPSTNNFALYGSHNIRQGFDEWENTEGMSFALQSSSAAIGAAVDISDDYPGLPYYGVKLDATWDIGAQEYIAGESATPRPGRSKPRKPR